MGVTNAVTVDVDAIAPITLVGPGAGGLATASAVVADIGDIARGVRTAPFGRPSARLTTSKKAPMQRHEGGYYIRLLAVDKPGTGGDHRQAAGAAEHLARVDRAASPRRAAAWRRCRRQLGRAGAGDPDYLCDHRGRRAQGARGRRPR